MFCKDFLFLFNRFVVSIILSGHSRDEVLDTIHNRLRELGDEMRTGKIDIEQYEINRVIYFLFLVHNDYFCFLATLERSK